LRYQEKRIRIIEEERMRAAVVMEEEHRNDINEIQALKKQMVQLSGECLQNKLRDLRML